MLSSGMLFNEEDKDRSTDATERSHGLCEQSEPSDGEAGRASGVSQVIRRLLNVEDAADANILSADTLQRALGEKVVVTGDSNEVRIESSV